MAIRNTPLLCGKGPAKLIFGRKLRNSLPRSPNTNSQFLDKTTKEKILNAKRKEKNYYNQHTTELPPLRIGSRVAIRSRVDTDWSLRGTIVEIGENHTYSVLTDQGSILMRNRKYLRPAPSWHECSAPIEATTQLESPEPPPPVNTRSWRREHGVLRDLYPQRQRNTRN